MSGDYSTNTRVKWFNHAGGLRYSHEREGVIVNAVARSIAKGGEIRGKRRAALQPAPSSTRRVPSPDP